MVVSGGLSTTGAARLAARGALRAGAGLVTIASPRDALAVNAAANLAIMVRPVDGPGELAELSSPTSGATRSRSGRAAGSGPEMREMVRAALASEAAVVLDADALTSFAEEEALLASEIAKRARPGRGPDAARRRILTAF